MRALALLVVLSTIASATSALAQSPARVSLLVGFGPGQGNDQPARPDAATFAGNRMSPDMSYDQTARFLARRLPRHLPGSPQVEARHAPGGSGFAAARRLASSPADGSVIALLSANVIYASALRLPGADFAAHRFTWLGGVATERWACIRRTDKPNGPIWTGTMGLGSRADTHARAMKRLAGAPLEIMSGYVSRFELIRGLENGEIDAACGWPVRDLETRRADWLASRRFEPFAIFSPSGKGPFAAPEDAVAAAALEALSWEADAAWPLAAPPGLPESAARTFMDALASMAADADAQDEAQRAGIVLEPPPEGRVGEIVNALHEAPGHVKDALALLFAPQSPAPSQARPPSLR